MSRRFAVPLATGVLLAVIALAAIAVRGEYPRTAVPRIALWAALFVACTVGGYAAARLNALLTAEKPLHRVITSMVLGIGCGILTAMLLYGLAFMVIEIMIATSGTNWW